MPPFVLAFVAVVGAVSAVRVLRREWKRVNRELDQTAAAQATSAPITKLKRDPHTGVWQPE